MDYYLAIDIGASSGRHILCSIEDGRMKLEEIYRFENNVILKDNHYCWDIPTLFQHIQIGIKECVKQNKIPKTLGIDTWAVDYVLLDNQGKLVDKTYAYRDYRHEKGYQNVLQKFSLEELYQRTGIQFQKFNTLFQLNSHDQDISHACDYLMIPDFLNYLLTGKKVNEYTNMSTTQLLDIKTNTLDQDILKQMNMNKDIFQDMLMPSSSLGCLSEDMQKVLGCNIEVILPATHDTGSAYMAAIEEDSIILSSGTWSLLGIETFMPIVSEESMKANFTNEGGYDYRYRFLKNIMGLWIIQEVSREIKGKYSFSELVQLARKSRFEGIFDVNDDVFLKPENMTREIMRYFEKRKQPVPVSIGDIAYCVYRSLAFSYKEAIKELEKITQKTYSTINIIGGGCQNELLNEMIADICNIKVIAGPVEATAIGNIVAQLIQQKIVKDLREGRELIRKSFEIKEYKGELYESNI
ncbi:rhamnulokinase [Coprobacillus cateniformis]|uniref:Rhamnulokinase n=1 Tax=Coprobacillus cateniformis TaxID=100884 RepID=E7G7S1_9FIRM|nr:rhamnulokinase [Coprobacillus cateniformis]EFW05842.1 rhamnulokinase [Coprobacillus cateniformis]